MRTRFLIGAFLASAMTLAPFAFAQANASSESRAAASTAASATQTANQEASSVKAGTKIDAELVSNVDARSAKPGDRVEARVLKNVKQDGRVVVHKGDMLVGKVTQAQAGATNKAGSQMSVAFDHLAGANGETQLNTVLTSVFSASAQQQDQMGLDASPMVGQPMSMPSSSGAMGGGAIRGGGGGGLLGGVGSTVGSTVGATTGAAGSVAGDVGATARGAGSTAGAVGSTVGGATGTLNAGSKTGAGANSNLGLATPTRAIHIQSAANADNETGMNSMLSTKHGDLRLDSGTRMQFRVAGSSEGRGKQQ